MRTIKEIRQQVESRDAYMAKLSIEGQTMTNFLTRRQSLMGSEAYEIAVTLLAEVDRLKEALLYIEYRTRHYPYAGKVVEGIVMDTLGTDYPND